MKTYIRIIGIFLFLVLFLNLTSVNAGFLDDLIKGGGNFFNPNSNVAGEVKDTSSWWKAWLDQNNTSTDGTGDGLAFTIVEFINKTIVPVISTIGNLIFFAVAAILGVKYVWSGVEGKSSVKETLPTFVVGASFFYLAEKIYAFTNGALNSILLKDSYDSLQNSIWSNLSLIVNILAISGIIALGLKYMFSSADTKADIKKDLIPVFIGLIFVFASSSILNFIANAGNQLIP